MQRYSRIFAAAFWISLILAYVFAVMPANEAPSISSSDKVEHIVAFMTLTILLRLAHPRLPAWAVVALLGGFGAFIEFSQMVPELHRDASLADWWADLLAVLSGLLIARVARGALAKLARRA